MGQQARVLGLVAVALLASGVGAAWAQTMSSGRPERMDEQSLDQRHEGYYFPEITSREVYGARAAPLADATRSTRVAFVTALTQQQLSKPYPPPFAVFAKGEWAEKMIIVSLGDHGFRSIYQARALLAQLTAVARTTPLLREMQVDEVFTFFDLLRLMGFEQITISDGETFAHQVKLD
jgi:hypothetical protein